MTDSSDNLYNMPMGELHPPSLSLCKLSLPNELRVYMPQASVPRYSYELTKIERLGEDVINRLFGRVSERLAQLNLREASEIDVRSYPDAEAPYLTETVIEVKVRGRSYDEVLKLWDELAEAVFEGMNQEDIKDIRLVVDLTDESDSF